MIRDDIAGQVASGLLFDGTYGIEIETEAKQQYSMPKFSFWNHKPDGSLRDFGIEYVLKVPLMYGKELNEALEEFKNKTAKINFIQDSNSTSVHVHINMLPEKWRTLANFLTIYTLVENVLMEVSGEFRRNNLFCLPIRSVPRVAGLMNELFTQVNRKNYNIGRILGNQRNEGVWNQIKYAALNLGCLTRFGSVEIRSFRGETDADVIHTWVSIFEQILKFSRMNVTPTYIMDQYKAKGLEFIQEIFGEYYEMIHYDNIEELIKPNIWYAGDLAYMLTEEQWNKLDEKVEKKVVQVGVRDKAWLDHFARMEYGMAYARLNAMNKERVNQVYDREVREGRIDPMPMPEQQFVPQPLNVNPVLDWLENNREDND